MEKDGLKEMFQLQKELQTRLNNKDISLNAEYFKDHHLALENELHEALREIPWKPWKKQQKWNVDLCKNELVDAFHFFMNLCICVGMDDKELFGRYCKKNKINHERVNDGY